MAFEENLIPKLSPHFESSQASYSSKSQPLLNFISIYSIFKIIFCHLFWLWWFTKELPNFLWMLTPNKLLWLVLSTLNLDPSRSASPQFKFFKICLLQVWTDLPFLVKFILFFFLKFWDNSGSLQMHQEITSPSLGSRKILHVLKSFHRTVGVHCFCSNSDFRVSVSETVSFLSVRGVNLASAHVGALLPAPPSYPVCRTVVWTGASVSGDVSRQRRCLPRWQNHPWRSAGASPAMPFFIQPVNKGTSLISLPMLNSI